jgi:formylglycine-generating enzyme required for sulfatase activity
LILTQLPKLRCGFVMCSFYEKCDFSLRTFSSIVTTCLACLVTSSGYSSDKGPLPRVTNSVGIEFAIVPAGDFQMGSSAMEAERRPDELLHAVRITKPFYIGIHEVTEEQYRVLMGEKTNPFRGAGDNPNEVPMAMINWHEAKEMCRRLSQLPEEQSHGRRYRLPTEAEWEYACRAGTKSAFHFGDSLNGQHANCDGERPYGTLIKGPYLGRLTKLACYKPNTLGLFDMHGNLWELCEDMYDADYYANSPIADPVCTTKSDNRVARGGSFANSGADARSAVRSPILPGESSPVVGVRLVMEMVEVAEK